MKVLVICGGRSAEREVSLDSSEFVIRSLEDAGHEVTRAEILADGSWAVEGRGAVLDANGQPWKVFIEDGSVPFDVVFPVLHGPLGEDGTIQGLCEIAGWRYAGADVMASAVAMNKAVFKRLASGSGIPVVPWVDMNRNRPGPPCEAVIGALGLPVFVKPSRLGSSVGISKVTQVGEFQAAVDLAFSFDENILVEKAVPSAREIEVSVLGDGREVSSSVPGEILPGKDWYDYEAKYRCEASRLVIPADLDPEAAAAVRSHAAMAFGLLGGRGYARVDFLIGAGEIFLNEINTIPGFTSISMFPKLWEATGLPARDLMDRILRDALERPDTGLSGGAR